MIDRLHYISQQPENGTHLTAIEQALKAGCTWIQLRVKDQLDIVILDIATAAKKLCDDYGAKLIINDHPEIAAEAGAYGVHLGLQDMSIAEARKIMGDEMIIGGTANTFGHVVQRFTEGADYVGLGPFRFTATKQKLSPILGLAGYETIVKQMNDAGISIPIIAIGGITANDVETIMQTGVYGVAISGAITFATDAEQTVKQLYGQLNTAAVTQY